MAKPPISIWVVLGPAALVILFTALLPLLSPIGKRPPDNAWNGFFYSDPNDPSLLVPKRHGIGYTLNFGNRWAWPVLLTILALALLPLLLAVYNLRALRPHS
jgi:hypothetical protein